MLIYVSPLSLGREEKSRREKIVRVSAVSGIVRSPDEIQVFQMNIKTQRNASRWIRRGAALGLLVSLS